MGRRDETASVFRAGFCRSAATSNPAAAISWKATRAARSRRVNHCHTSRSHWEFGEDVSWVEVRFSDGGAGRARLTLTHTALLSDHWGEYGPGAVGVGWELGLMGLAIHLSQPTEPKPDEAAFATSPHGKALITGSSERWGQAAVEAGTEPDAARAAARRTTAFYTGESTEPA